jgi:hypothetical protein
VLARLARLWRRSTTATAPAPAILTPPDFAADVAATGISTAEWCRRRRAATALYSTISSAAAANLRERHAARVHSTASAAERVLRHEFDLLGSGPYVPVDPERKPRDGYTPIDWYLDPVRRLRFPRAVPHTQWNLFEMRPGNADIKYPWELARCQHWTTVGQAFVLTDDDRFAREIARQLDDFVEANPTGIGVNWTCTMDVGLRAVSWAMALELVRTSPALDDAFWTRAYQALFDTGVFIRGNLENKYEVTSNHFLSNLLGLQFLGAVFAGLEQGAEWTSFSHAAIEHEMDVQVLPDGADYESSIPYHRLVTELFLGAARLADHLGAPLSPACRARLRDMFAYLAATTRPDGLMPQAGDADDGRLHILEGYGITSPQDARHLFGPAAAMFGEAEWRALGGDAGAWEAAWWGFDADAGALPGPDAAATAVPVPVSPVARLFPQAGTAVARTTVGHYLLVTNGIVGTNGFGNHKHNDLLSFEYHHHGVPLIVDPGSYVYTSDADARNLFRGTASHNTLMVDGVEQNDLRPDWLFRLFETSHAESISFADNDGVVEYVGRHHGYERLPDPVTHERTVQFTRQSGKLVIVDRLLGRGRHSLRWHFHLAPGVSAERAGGAAIALTAAARRPEASARPVVCALHVPSDVAIAIRPAAYSPSYGVQQPCLAIDLSADVDLDGERRWTFSIES